MKKYFNELVREMSRKETDAEGAMKIRRELARKYKPKVFPSLIEMMLHANSKERRKIGYKVKPTRTISGVSVVAIMTKPMKCPHGKCAMCPGGINSYFGDVPQSYTGREPATMRGIRNEYDPYLQIFNRLEHYVLMDHVPDKVELIIMGGTFLAAPKRYKKEFVKYAFKALNDFGEMFFFKNELDFEKFKEFFELPHKVGNREKVETVKKKILELKGRCRLKEEQERNEKVKIRCVGMTIETRPDYAGVKEVNEMLELGCTRVELGVQSVYDDVLKKIERGHTTKENIEAMKILKDAGFKINAHYLLGFGRDLEGLKKLFTDKRYRPDMLKIYPCMVMKGTKLYEEWKKGRYKALELEKAAKLIAEFKNFIPPYCRIQRIQRDIASNIIEAGVNMTNLRQYIHENYKFKCRCIRCREIGHVLNKNKNIKIGNIEIKTICYHASEGEEFFISAEDIKNDIIFGFCRLRFPTQTLRKEITKNSALIRELHVCSPALAIGHTSEKSFQHRGIGKKLLKTAEKIAQQNKKIKMIIISGVGVRSYYKKFNYNKEGPYMTKIFN